MQDYLDAFKLLVTGVPATLFLTVAGLFVSFWVAFGATAASRIGGKWLAKFVQGYVTVFTGTPLLFQYFIFYYSPTQFSALNGTWLMDLFNNVWFIAILTIGLNSGAYSTVLFQGALKNIDAGQWECCKAMGLSRRQAFFLLFPYALRRALPSYSNEVILLFKGTSLVSMITVTDVFGLARQYYGETYDAITAFVTAGVVYLLISLCLSLLLRLVEKFWLPHAAS